MVAHVLRLRIALLLGALRGTPVEVARRVALLVIVSAAVVAAAWALLSLGDAPAAVLFVVTVLGGSAIALGFVVAPLVGGTVDQLDPRRFAPFGVAPLKLAGILALASLVSIPTVALLVVAIAAAVAWVAHGVPVGVAALSVLLGVLTCALAARLFMALSALAERGRRRRERWGVAVLIVLGILVPAALFLVSLEWRGRVPAQLVDVAAAFGTTPLGAAWALPGSVVAESGATTAIVVAVVTFVVVAGGWVWIVRHAVTSPDRPVAARDRGGLGWFALLPGTPGGAIASRSLVYWLSDRRYLVSIVVIPVAAALTIVPLLVAGVPLAYVVLIPAPFIALFFGWLPHNDIAYDSSAVWMHIAGGVRGVADRLGRLAPIILIGVPVIAAAVVVSVAVNGDWSTLPALSGVCASLFLSGLGLSSIASAVAPYAVSRPGESPFRQPQRTGTTGALAPGLVLVGALVATLPTFWWAWLSLTTSPESAQLALWGGIGIGLGVLLIGLAVGSFAFERRGSRLMEFAEST